MLVGNVTKIDSASDEEDNHLWAQIGGGAVTANCNKTSSNDISYKWLVHSTGYGQMQAYDRFASNRFYFNEGSFPKYKNLCQNNIVV